MNFDIHFWLLIFTCPIGGAPIGGIMGGIIPGGMGARLGGLWPMGGIPIGGKWGGIPGGPIFRKHTNSFYKKIQIQYANDRGYNQRAAKTEKVVTLQQVEAFQTPTYKGWGDSWRWDTRIRWCSTGATISISRGLLWTKESITVTTTVLIKMLSITDRWWRFLMSILMTEVHFKCTQTSL